MRKRGRMMAGRTWRQAPLAPRPQDRGGGLERDPCPTHLRAPRPAGIHKSPEPGLGRRALQVSLRLVSSSGNPPSTPQSFLNLETASRILARTPMPLGPGPGSPISFNTNQHRLSPCSPML